ncbi:MAG: DUF1189 family protein [Candidatus Caenarcaniphilales bacterium]|nr:DUF1189 family protein [Candidatus Caenarcaniphilales bacterium]
MQETSSPNPKIGFFRSLIASCFDLGAYPLFREKTWLSIAFHVILLVILLSSALSFALYRNLQKETYKLFQGLPTLIITSEGVNFPNDISLPYVKTFPAEEGAVSLAFVLDDGHYLEVLRKFYKNAVFFTNSDLFIQSGAMSEKISARELAQDQSFQAFFGKPPEITPLKLSQFTSAVSVIWLMLLMPFPKLPFIFPLPIILILSLLFSAFTASSVAQTLFRESSLNYPEVFRLAIFAATPGILILMVGISLLSWEWTGALFITSWFLQIAYLVSGLRACEPEESRE